MIKEFNDKEYWSKYYETILKSKKNISPSDFAKYLVENDIVKTDSDLVELGCGNGRDSIYFSSYDVNVTAIDQCSNTTTFLNNLQKINSFADDFTRLSSLRKNVDVVYSRFTLHSVDAQGEKRTLKWVYDNLKTGGFFCIEVRTINDPIFGLGQDKGENIWFYNNHHRRFVDAKEFKKDLINLDFNLFYFDESNGYAKYEDQDPVLLRVIAKKQ
tara:strand:+ start:2521 stop:3162 length:642 start_codon:yes stop_codon:yes gene_type:complete